MYSVLNVEIDGKELERRRERVGVFERVFEREKEKKHEIRHDPEVRRQR